MALVGNAHATKAKEVTRAERIVILRFISRAPALRNYERIVDESGKVEEK